jgi:hypothetical protein
MFKFLSRVLGPPRPAVGMLSPTVVDAIQPAAVEDSATGERAQPTAAEAAAQEKKRLTAILNSDAAQGKEKLAQTLALTTDLPTADAIAILAAYPCEVAARSPIASEQGVAVQNSDFFARHMQMHPELWNGQPPMSADDTISRISQNYAAATGETTHK